MKYIKLFENFDAEREMSDILGYDVKLFHQVNKLLFLTPEELEEWFEEEIGKDQPNWNLIEILQSQHGIEFNYKDLHWAVEHDKVGLAKYWLDKGIDKDARDSVLRTPLHWVAIYNSEAVAKVLIDAGADKDAKNMYLWTPLHYAAYENSERVAKLLIDAGADKGAKDVEGNIPWHYASDELCQSLPELNPEVKQFESETFDAEREMSDILGYDVKLFHQVNKLLFLSQEELQEWFEDEMGKEEPRWDLIKILESQHSIEFDYKDLHWTAQNDSVGLAKYWLDKGVEMDVMDKYRWTPLHWAAEHNSEAVAKLLIDAGADKDAQTENLKTPLHYAASYNSEAVAKLLIDAGADKGAKDDDLWNPLHYAAMNDRERVAKLLLDAGADKEAINKYLRTPLHFAVIYDSEAVAKLLLDAGVDKGSKDNKGNTAWDLAGSKLRQSLPELNPDA